MMDDPRASGQDHVSRTVGLCAHCAHVQLIVSDKGSRFYLCRMSFIDVRFPRYPPLPVVECSGYTAEPHQP